MIEVEKKKSSRVSSSSSLSSFLETKALALSSAIPFYKNSTSPSHHGTGVKHRSALRDRDHSDSSASAPRHQTRSVERVDGDVDADRVRSRRVADVLAAVEHGGVVLFA